MKLIADVDVRDRLAYLVPEFRGGGRSSDIDPNVLATLASDYLGTERLSWAACVRRLGATLGDERSQLPHARTLLRRLRKVRGDAANH